MGDQNIIDKSMRSVFVGNIPYEATEEKLKDIFNEVGPVVSFKLVYDRETGKPKGYGFCEYKDQETALSAMRNLNGYEIGGRSLRVDNACTEKSRLEMQSLMAGPPIDNTYGEAVESDKAPEAISKAVASLPPEQMFELMKQMKVCIQNNPSEGRAMLLQNPQLAYALLQAQVVMRIVDPQTAITMLHKSNPPVAPLMTATDAPRGTSNASRNDSNDWIPPQRNSTSLNQNPTTFMDVDLRSMDPRAPRNPVPTVQDQDLRIPPMVAAPVQAPPFGSVDHGPRDPRGYARDPRGVTTNPTRVVPPVALPPRPVAQPTVAPQPTQPSAIPTSAGLAAAMPTGASDQEKAALIMQVLQLSDEQISMLPPEQRKSILVLKEQIAKSTQR